MSNRTKKAMSMLLVVALMAVIAVGGMLAYLSDKDGEANVFTVGNVDIELNEVFDQGSPLKPGVTVEKIPTVENKGKDPAWVWTTVAVPKALDSVVGFLEKHSDWEWTTIPSKVENVNGIDYTVYTALYNKKLEPGKETEPVFKKVRLDGFVDVDENGNWSKVEGGIVTDLGWKDANGNPVIYVNAYAMQTDSVDSAKDAHDLYIGQWGAAGEYAEVVNAESSKELSDAVNNADEPTMVLLAKGEYTNNFKVEGGKDITIVGMGTDTVLKGQIATTASDEGTLTIKNATIKVDSSIVDSTGISQTGKSAIAIWGDQTVICENVTFDMSLADSTAITSWWDTGKGTSIIVRDCTFNCNGQRPIRATGNVTVENCTFNDPYRYAVQLTAKASTATELDKAIINFNNNEIVNGPNGKAFVYGIQLEGADYGCHDCIINGAGNSIVDGGTDSAMYYCECGKVDHDTIKWNVEDAAVVHEE